MNLRQGWTKASQDDEGASLILALVIVTIFGIVIGSLLSLTDTNVRTTEAVRSQAADSYDADGAAQAAISALRHNGYNNNTASATFPKCFGSTSTSDTLVLSNFYPGVNGGAASSAAVSCSPDPATGAAGGSVPITVNNRPGNAILTSGTSSSEDGVNVKALNNSLPFIVKGSVISSSNINVSNGSLQASSSVTAHTGCSGTITSTPAAVCNGALPTDPNYRTDSDINGTGVPAYQTLPTTCPNKVMTFLPGYYDDAVGLSNLMSGACSGSIWWFTPGTYYFDFHNSAGLSPLASGSDVWNLSSGQLLAGQPVDSSGNVLTKPTSPLTIPGSCNSPLKSTAAAGVQFIFGGDSQLLLSGSADAEICGSYRTDRPPIAVYGLKSGSASPVAATNFVTTSVASTSTPAYTGGATGLTAGIAAAGDTKYDTWTATNANSTGSLTGSFAGLPTIPAGSLLTSATLTVTYGASDAMSSRQLVLTASNGSTVTPTVSAAKQNDGTSQSFNLLTTGSLPSIVHSAGLSSLGFSYSVAANKNNTVDKLDAMTLSLGYVAPAFRGETTTSVAGNCLNATFTGKSNGGCALIGTPNTGADYKGNFYIQGTTYAWNAPVSLALANAGAQVLRFGLIARVFYITEPGSTNYTGPVIEVPDVSPGFGPGGTTVYLTVYVCPGSSTCSTTTGKLRLRARVFLYDPSSSMPRQVIVQSWAVVR